jgi:four helix bundle protein
MAESAKGGSIKTYRDLVAWQKAMALAELLYKVTTAFPSDERFGLISQMRRAGVSVPSNIAEGYGRARTAEYCRYLEISRGSLYELQTQAELARRFGWLQGKDLSSLRDAMRELDAVLGGLLRSVKRRIDKSA